MSFFKEGDWVTHDDEGTVFRLNKSHFIGITAMNKKWFRKLNFWSPKLDEYCVVWNTKGKVQIVKYKFEYSNGKSVYTLSNGKTKCKMIINFMPLLCNNIEQVIDYKLNKL